MYDTQNIWIRSRFYISLNLLRNIYFTFNIINHNISLKKKICKSNIKIYYVYKYVDYIWINRLLLTYYDGWIHIYKM